MTDPPVTASHFNWGDPVAPDGSLPLDYLMGWLKTNLTKYRQATDKQEALSPLCRELNEPGVKCSLANSVVELECLTHTAWHTRTWITHAMYESDLFESYFDGEEPELVRSHREFHMRGYIATMY
ncbi:hypothetical protein F441_15737 [Phytophthora nicotianae CJ01A1]|uniref:Uncharacterized protein n=3 Tax=Phytophthora nicotianae TaxID=4792 RepID=W2YMP7_PHYNI|nr:hypothetical protein L915_15455 [Phytophthora nicotianae]ETM38363.1 hypothetical protein L914_15315 [Phytophthora nicotianae]ETP08230.1 hypothetical protein F441_15737 [Phytophthora nicotianae CJ01A1]ETP36295.1 hypothetical protein F442_15746 [Phytophthora nicotianae P10297]